MSNTIRKLVIFSVLSIFAGVPAFAQKVTLKFHEAKVQTVLQSIKQQTKLDLVYSDQILDVNRKVSINLSDTEVKDAIKLLLKGTDTGFEIRNGKIYFIEKKHLLSSRVTIKGNVSEIKTIYAGCGNTKGVDADEKDSICVDNIMVNAEMAKELPKELPV